MKKKTLVQIRHIANRIPKQLPYEIVTFLYTFYEEWKFTFFNGCLIFIPDGTPVFVLPIKTIQGTLKTSDTLYILCHNGVLHYFDRMTHQHCVTILDNTDENFFCCISN